MICPLCRREVPELVVHTTPVQLSYLNREPFVCCEDCHTDIYWEERTHGE